MNTPTNSEALPLTNCSALPDMPPTPGWYWVRSRIPNAPWAVCETHENENGVSEWRDDGESWPIEPNRADFVGPLIPPNVKVHTPLPATADDETGVKP